MFNLSLSLPISPGFFKSQHNCKELRAKYWHLSNSLHMQVVRSANAQATYAWGWPLSISWRFSSRGGCSKQIDRSSLLWRIGRYWWMRLPRIGKALVPLADKGDAILGDFFLALQSDLTRHLNSFRKLPVDVRALVAPCKRKD